ncbi:hypothetical protein P9112_009354 [Eukaryota sp. TZLM1-RC]
MNSLFSRSPNKGEELRLNSLEDADKIAWFLDQLLFTYSIERLKVSNREDENQEEEEVEDAAFTSDESNDGSETEDEAGLSESEELVFNASDETYPKGLNLTRHLSKGVLNYIYTFHRKALKSQRSIFDFLVKKTKFKKVEEAHRTLKATYITKSSEEIPKREDLVMYASNFLMLKRRCSLLELQDDYFMTRFAKGLRNQQFTQALLLRIEAKNGNSKPPRHRSYNETAPVINTVNYSASASRKNEPFTVPVTIHSKTVNSLLDTGSDRTYISPKLVSELRLKTRPITCFVKGINSTSQAHYESQVSFVIQTHFPVEISTIAIIHDIDYDIILVRDVLVEIGIQTADDLFSLISDPNLDDDNVTVPSAPSFNEERIPERDQRQDWETIPVSLAEGEKHVVQSIVKKYAEVFEGDSHELGIDSPPTTIPLIDESVKITSKPRFLPPRKLKIAHEILDDLVSKDVARYTPESDTSQFRTPAVLLEYRTKKPRLCGDYNKLNEETRSETIDLPTSEEIFNKIEEANYIGIFDLPRAYYQLPVANEDIAKTTLSVPGKSVQFLRSPFGLKNLPSVFQSLMTRIFKNDNTEIYIDDLIVLGKNFEDFLKNLDETLNNARKSRIKLSAKKSLITLKTNPFTLLGVIGDFIPHFASITAPLYDLTAKDAKFHLSENHLDSIQRLKNAVTKAVPLNLPSPSDHLIVITDASDEGIGGAIFKTSRTSFDPSIPQNEQDLVPLCFHSKKFLKSQKNWSTNIKELYAIVNTLTQCSLSKSLLSRRFTILTDHKNLLHLHKSSNPMVQRWLPVLGQYEFSILHLKGKNNELSDSLSRCFTSTSYTPVTLQDFLVSLNTNPTLEVPENLRREILKASHADHASTSRTLAELKSKNLHWKTMKSDVEQYVQECAACQKSKKHGRPSTTSSGTLFSDFPFECIHIDLMELPKDEHGYSYILVCVDAFTRFAFLTPLKNKSSEVVADVLYNSVFLFLDYHYDFILTMVQSFVTK